MGEIKINLDWWKLAYHGGKESALKLITENKEIKQFSYWTNHKLWLNDSKTV